MKKVLVVAFLAFTLVSCATQAPSGGGIPIDLVPMYGGMNRNADPGLKEGDEQFIAGVTREFGTREKASAEFVETGFQYFRSNDLANAMRRFNQSWLLNPDNPEAYVGFASVISAQGKACEATRLMEKALALNPPEVQGIYPDAGSMFALCGASDKSLSPTEKLNVLRRSEEIFAIAEQVEPNKAYVYDQWATAYFWRGQLAEAWTMVKKQRAAGGVPDEEFLQLLRSEMPEPN